MELPSKLTRIWLSLVGSPKITSGALPSNSHFVINPFLLASTDTRSRVASTHRCKSKGWYSRSITPASILEKSRMLFIIDSSDSPLLRMVSKHSFWFVVRSSSSRRPVMPMTAFMGVLISWLMFARNSDLALVAASAASLAFLSISSDRLSSVMSRETPRTAVTPLEFFLRGTIWVSIQTSLPQKVALPTELRMVSPFSNTLCRFGSWDLDVSGGNSSLRGLPIASWGKRLRYFAATLLTYSTLSSLLIMKTKSGIASERYLYRSSLSMRAFSSSLRSVMSSPELSVPTILPFSSLITEFRQVTSLSSPWRVMIGFSKWPTDSSSPDNNLLKAALTSSLILSGIKVWIQSLPTISSLSQARILHPFSLMSMTLPSVSRARIITPAISRSCLALSLSWINIFSICFRSVISRTIAAIPLGFPVSSLKRNVLSSTGNIVPSFRLYSFS